MERQNLINEIIVYFSHLESMVKLSNFNGFSDINNHAEDSFCRVLNKVFGLSLVNLNVLRLSFPSIDLGDEEAGVSFQVTSETGVKKIKETISKFEENHLSAKFNRLRFLILTTKKNDYRSEIVGPTKVSFNKDEDIINLSKLIGEIRALDISKIKEVANILMEEFDSQKKNKIEGVLASEVETIADLVVFLTNNKKLDSKSWIEEPDPERKIEYRFSNESKFLKEQIVDLLPRYSLARSEVDNVLNFDTVKLQFARDFLRVKSDIFLTQADGNPKKALDNLTEFFEKSIGKNGKKYDYMAIRFYLLDELIKCNVFPN